MKYVAYHDVSRKEAPAKIGVLINGRVAEVATVDDFYADLPRYRATAISLLEGADSSSHSADPAKSRGGAWQVPLGSLTPAVPVPVTARILCAGLNYRRHAEETESPLPDHPDVFGRFASTLVPTGSTVPLPARERQLDWEGELAAVVGATLRDVDPATAADGILAFTCFNDLSARTFQFAGAQATLGKNADCSGPIGHILSEPGDVGAAKDLRITTMVNSVVKQDSTTADLIFTAAEIIAYVSGVMTLHPGDVISTGTPSGVGFSRRPPEALRSGDVVQVRIEGLGEIETRIG